MPSIETSGAGRTLYANSSSLGMAGRAPGSAVFCLHNGQIFQKQPQAQYRRPPLGFDRLQPNLPEQCGCYSVGRGRLEAQMETGASDQSRVDGEKGADRRELTAAELGRTVRSGNFPPPLTQATEMTHAYYYGSSRADVSRRAAQVHKSTGPTHGVCRCDSWESAASDPFQFRSGGA